MLLVTETFVCLNVDVSIPIKVQTIFECLIMTERCRQLPVYRGIWVKKGKAVPLQAWTGYAGSRRLRLPDFKTIGI